MNLPSQLATREFRFIKVREKSPVEVGWNILDLAELQAHAKDKFRGRLNNYEYDDPEFLEWIKHDNYGVMCGVGNIVVLDVDDPALLDIIGTLPDTFTVRTGGGGLHFYLRCPGQEKIVLDNGVHLGELQAAGQQVVGPGSRHPSGNFYAVEKDLPIASISKEELQQILQPAMKPNWKKIASGTADSDIPIAEVAMPVDPVKNNGVEIQGAHPVHGSETGRNFSINLTKNCWHCFRHNTGGGPLEWLAIEAGLIRCEDAKPGCLSNGLFKKALGIARDRGFNIPNGPTVIDAIRALDSVCDRATSKDGCGFSRFDREEHSDLIDKAINEGTLDPKEEKAAYRFIKKYTKQLNKLGIEFDDIGHIAREDGDVLAKINDRIPAWIEEHHFKTVADTEKLYHYAHGVYLDDGETILKTIIEQEFGDISDNRMVSDVIGKVKRRTYIDRELFNNGPILNVQNGLLNLETLELKPHTPDYLSTSQISVTYNKEATAPKIRKFLNEVAKPGDIALIEEIIGWLLWPDYNVHKAIMFIGPGRNGKGTLLRLITAFLGKKSVSNVTLQDLVADRFAKADLYGKLANIGGDLPSKDLSDTAAFRNLTGGDDNRAQEKYRAAFNFRNKAKMLFPQTSCPGARTILTPSIPDGYYWNS